MKKALLIGGAGFIGHHLALSLKANGFDVAVVDGLEVNNLISDSIKALINNDIENAARNSLNATPNVNGSILLEYHTINFGYDQLVHMIETKHDISQYDLILLPPDEDTHHDHKKINVVGMALTRKERCGIIDYKTPSTLETWTPNFFSDITDFLDTKITQLHKFKTQAKHLYFTENVIKSFHTNYQCARRGLGYVEQFKIHRLYN